MFQLDIIEYLVNSFYNIIHIVICVFICSLFIKIIDIFSLINVSLYKILNNFNYFEFITNLFDNRYRIIVEIF